MRFWAIFISKMYDTMTYLIMILLHVSLPSLPRVTIFGKAKIGTMDGHFARGQIYGLFNYFYNKIGTLKFTCRLECAGKRRGSK